MPYVRFLFSALLAVAAVGAQNDPVAGQRKLDGRAFVPPTPLAEVAVDFKAMRDSDVWDGLTGSIASSLLPLIEQELGFSLSRLDRFRFFPCIGSPAPGMSSSGVMIFESAVDLDVPARSPGEDATIEKIAGHEATVAFAWPQEDPTIWVAPQQGVLVYGARHLVAPVLEGTQTPGVTPPELLSLVAGRGVLAHMVVTCDDETRTALHELFTAPAELPGPDFVMARLRLEPPADKADDPRVLCEARLRWSNAEKVPAAFAALVRTRLDELKKHRRYAALKKIWNLIEVGTDARDVTFRIDFGRPREAGGLFALAAPMLMFTARSAEVQAQQVQLAIPPAAPETREVTEPPPPPPPEPGQPGGQQPAGGNGGNGRGGD